MIADAARRRALRTYALVVALVVAIDGIVWLGLALGK